MKKIILISAICAICSGVQSQSWNLTGNSGTDASINFIGTTDNIPFKIRTKNVVRVTVNGSGKVGIGISSPVFKLDVKGGSINTDSVYRIGGNTVLSVKGINNIFLGVNSGFSNTTGSSNTGIGVQALYSNTSGYGNTAAGSFTLKSNTTGHGNCANGNGALYSNTDGYENTAIGNSTLYTNTTGDNNTAIGSQALFNNISGGNNTACGNYALNHNTGGGANTAVGASALYSNNDGDANTAIGQEALAANTYGYSNIAIGFEALYSNTTGYGNAAVGSDALFRNTTGSSNSASGYEALNYNIDGADNTADGRSALFLNTTGHENTASGSSALYSNTSGTKNTAAGVLALVSNTVGNSNSAFGEYSLHNDSSGNSNTGCGTYALYANKTGSYNSALGSQAFFDSTFLNNTTCIGNGSGGFVNANNRIELGNTSVGVIAGQVGFSTYSDARIKDNVKEDVPGLSFISKLRPVTYNLNIHKENTMVYKGTKKDEADWSSKYDIEKIKMTGFLAQDVEKAAEETGYDFSGVQKPANPDELYSLRYSDFVMPLVKAVQQLAAKNNEQDLLIENLKAEINNLKSNSKQSEINNPKSEILFQNSPNPFNSETQIKFQLPMKFSSAMLVISDENGKQIRAYTVQSANPIVIKAGELSTGKYSYSLIVDGIAVDSKQMVLTK
jgi:hypothetical protein